MNFDFPEIPFSFFSEQANASQNNFENNLESYNNDSDNFMDENNKIFFFSPKPNSIQEKDELFKEKEDNFKDDKLDLEENNYFENPPLFKEQINFFKLPGISYIDLGNTKTKNTTKMLGYKTRRNDIENNNITNNVENNGEKKKKKQGRKKKEELDKRDHNKQSDDNIMRKIKSYFLSYTHNILNKSIKEKKLHFLKLNSEINENLKRDYNLNLLNTTFKEIYEKSSISTKYRKQIKDGFDKNKQIIKKIYEKNEEIEAIKILNLTYRELFNVFRRNIKNISSELETKIKDISILNENEFKNINNFFEEIENQEKYKNESEENIKNYLENIKKLCLYYEEWFLCKKGRNRSKKEKIK